MKTKLALLFILLGIMSVLVIPPTESSAQEKVVNLRFSNYFPAPHQNNIIMENWCKEIEKRTNGRVKWSYYAAATLTPPVQTYDSVVKGIADAGESLMGFNRGKFPLTEAIDLPLGAKTGYLATKMINAYYAKFNPKEFDEVKVMYLHCYGPALIWTKTKPVNKLEDLKGLKIRSHGLSAKVVQALGAAPVGMPMNETYDAISRGVAEGVMCPTEAMKGWKLGEVCGYGIESYGTAQSAGFYIVMNKGKWNALAPDVQKIIEAINVEWIEKQGKLWDEIDKEGRDVFVQSGKKFITLSSEESARWASKMGPILDEYVKDMKAKGLPGEEALKFCQDYLKANQK
jgi:TRAP-type C4-dicarboxylate transport system substrate-binding protein